MKKLFAIGCARATQRLSVYRDLNDHIDMSKPLVTYRPEISAFGLHPTRIALLRRFVAFVEPDMADTIDAFSEEHIKRVAAPHLRGRHNIYKVIQISPPTVLPV